MTSSDTYAPYVSDFGGVLKSSSSDGIMKAYNDENEEFLDGDDTDINVGMNNPGMTNYQIEYNYLLRCIYPFNSCNLDVNKRNFYNKIYHGIFLVICVLFCAFLVSFILIKYIYKI